MSTKVYICEDCHPALNIEALFDQCKIMTCSIHGQSLHYPGDHVPYNNQSVASVERYVAQYELNKFKKKH